WRRSRRALCAAHAIHRSGAVQPVALARPVDDGDRRRLRLLLRSLPWRHDCRAAPGMAALHAGGLPDALRDRGHRAPDLVADRHPGDTRSLPRQSPHQDRVRAPRRRKIETGDGAMSAVLEVTNIKKSFGGITAVSGVSFDVHEGEILGLIGPNG